MSIDPGVKTIWLNPKPQTACAVPNNRTADSNNLHLHQHPTAKDIAHTG